MMGRHALSDHISKAEEFISNQFELAGLEVYSDNETYHQTFSIIESEVIDANVSISNSRVDESQLISFTNQTDFSGDQSTIETAYINSNDNFRSEFNRLRDSETDLIVFVHPSFDELFDRYRSFYQRANRFLKEETTSNIVFVLNDAPDDFEISISSELTERTLSNLVGVIEGNQTDEFVIISAHHDHIGIRTPVASDSIANGANDNGSGVTAVIQMANHFSSKPKPERTLLFVTFTAEEIGGYGSQYFSSRVNPDEIVAMFNIEMIGKPALSGPNTAWITGYDRSTFGEILSQSTEGTNYEFYPDPYPNQNLFFRSDNATLARLGVPAHSISTTPIDRDNDYHQVTDEIDTINISHLNNTIKAIAKAAEGIISGVHTPTRVDISQLD